MKAQTFLANFAHIADAPEGVKRLRELVLHLAVSGRLVQMIPSEGGAEVSISEATALKNAYRASLKLRLSDAGSVVAESEQAFEIPAYWKWERLGNIACYIQRGKGPKYDDAGNAFVISQKCVQWTGFDLSLARRISNYSIEDYGHERFLVGGDILWNSTGTGTAGRMVVYPGIQAKEKAVADSHVTVIRLTNFLPTYVWCFLASPTVQKRMIPGQENSMVTGTTNQVELSTSQVSALPVPCPPVAEQKRIVAKVNELMALCDQLEAQQQEREQRFPVLSRTCHANFAEAPTPANLNRIFDETRTVSPDDLRKTILTLAVQGKLVPQDPSDKLGEQLPDVPKKAERNKPKWAGPIEELERPFQLPSSWMWFRLGDISSLKHGYAFSSEFFTSEPAPFVLTTPGNFYEKGGFRDRESKRKYYSGPVDPEFIFKPGDLIIPMTEQAEGLLGSPAFIPDDGRVYIHNQRLGKLSFSEAITPKFAFWFFNCEFFRGELSRTCTGMKVRHTSPDRILKVPFPVCPIAEQRRIVAKVDELMTLVDHLEEQQHEEEKLAANYAKACVATFTGTNIERREKMKAPKIELVSVLTIGKKAKANVDAPLATLLSKHKGEVPAKILWQLSGLAIDAFYQQLKSEIVQGWIAPPVEAEMKVLEEA